MKHVFIIGAMERSGTNYFQQLLCLHPRCLFNAVSEEDFLVAKAFYLRQYVEETFLNKNRLRKAVDVSRDESREAYLKEFGETILGHYERYFDQDGCNVLKTPSSENLQDIDALFPDAHIILLVRDGRAAVESWRNARFCYDRSFTSAVHKWACGASRIMEYDKLHKGKGRHLVVRYEDVITDLDHEMRRVFEFLDEEPALYDMQEAAELGVVNSSFLPGDRKNTGESLKAPAGFDPLARFSGWRRSQHERFNWIAGDVAEHFGYALQKADGQQAWWALRNSIADAVWAVRFFCLLLLKAGLPSLYRKIWKTKTLNHQLWRETLLRHF